MSSKSRFDNDDRKFRVTVWTLITQVANVEWRIKRHEILMKQQKEKVNGIDKQVA